MLPFAGIAAAITTRSSLQTAPPPPRAPTSDDDDVAPLLCIGVLVQACARARAPVFVSF